MYACMHLVDDHTPLYSNNGTWKYYSIDDQITTHALDET